jgi:hypothetical protein
VPKGLSLLKETWGLLQYLVVLSRKSLQLRFQLGDCGTGYAYIYD